MIRRFSWFLGSLQLFLLASETEAFSFQPQWRRSRSSQQSFLSSSAVRTNAVGPVKETKHDDENDQALFKSVKKTQLIDLCTQYGVVFTQKDTKMVLLTRLREHAEREAEAARERLIARRRRVEENDNPKERFESLDNGIGEEEDEEAVFFYFDPSVAIDNTTSASSTTDSKLPPASTASTREQVLAPPDFPDEPNEDGERVVTIYSSEDQNDLTGIVNTQASRLDPDMASHVQTSAAWDMPTRQTSKEHERAREEITELIGTLLASTGAPGFIDPDDDDINNNDEGLLPPHTRTNPAVKSFVGFDPSKVPSDLLLSKSSVLRTGRGKLLEDVLYQFEVRAIAQDGTKGDNRQRGGGHYAEVSKVRAFVEGFRRAEVRRLARETTTILLEKLMQEGVEGLDLALSTMTRSDDDTGDYAGELNDSLLDFLNDAIRHQERKVDQLVAERFREDDEDEEQAHATDDLSDDDPVNQLWNVTIEDGQRVESIDPNDPKVIQVLQDEVNAQSNNACQIQLPETAPEKVLLLLTLLRERVKTEAAFAPDERGRNLRLLAYCLRLDDDKEREGLILKTLGNSLERLDSFIELVSSSIEYAESTYYELRPAKTQTLNRKVLKRILKETSDLRKLQAIKASGLVPS